MLSSLAQCSIRYTTILYYILHIFPENIPSLTALMADRPGQYVSSSVQTHPETGHGQKKLSWLLFSGWRLLASQPTEKFYVFLLMLLKFFSLQSFT